MARSSARQGAEDRPARVLIDDFHHIRYDCPPSAPTATLCMPGYPLATCALAAAERRWLFTYLLTPPSHTVGDSRPPSHALFLGLELIHAANSLEFILTRQERSHAADLKPFAPRPLPFLQGLQGWADVRAPCRCTVIGSR